MRILGLVVHIKQFTQAHDTTIKYTHLASRAWRQLAQNYLEHSDWWETAEG